MAQFWIPGDSDFALAMREPNLLVPNRRPVTEVSPNDRFPNPLCLFVNDWNRPLGKLSGAATSGISINPGYIGNDGTGSFVIDKTEIDGASTLTVIVRHRWLSRTLRDGVFGHRTASGFNLNISYGDPSQLFLYCGDSSNYVKQFTPVTGAIADNQWFNFVVRFDGNLAASSRVGVWINGLHQSFSWNSAPGTTLPLMGGVNFSLCAGNDPSNCEQEIAGIYTQAFSDAVCQEISRNPFILLQPANDAPFIFTVAGGGVQVDLTGLSSTTAVGTLGVTAEQNVSVPLTGLSSTTALGTIAVSVGTSTQVDLTGLSSTTAIGTMSAATEQQISVELTGLSSTTGLGTLSVAVGGGVSVGLTTTASTTAVGSLTVVAEQAVTVDLTGISSTTAIGTLSVSTGTNVSVTPAGVAATTALGTLAVATEQQISYEFSGVAATAAVGTLAITVPTAVSLELGELAATGYAGTLGVTTEGNTWNPVSPASTIWTDISSTSTTWAEI